MELPFANLQEKYLYKIEIGKSNAPAADWARLSAQGIFPFSLLLNSRTYTLCAVSGSLGMNMF